MLKYLTTIIILFLFCLPVLADEVSIEQSMCNSFVFSKRSIQTFKAVDSTMTAISLWISNNGGGEEIYVKICKGDNPSLAKNLVREPTYHLACATDEEIGEILITNPSSTLTESKYAFTDVKNMVVGDDYYFLLWSSVSTSSFDWGWCFSDNSNPYPDGWFYDSVTYDLSFKVHSDSGPTEPLLNITNSESGDMKIIDSWVEISGDCPTNGAGRIALTNDCSDFSNLEFNIDCVDGSFSSQFFYDGSSDFLVVVEKDSTATDCLDYDELMDVIEIDGIEVIEGYPDEWHFNYNYYDDYDIIINSPVIIDSLTLPLGSSDVDVSFRFIYPASSTDMIFNISQYNENGSLIDGDFHTVNLSTVSDTSNYIVNLIASSSPLHYVVKLSESEETKRQFPFGIFVSDIEFVYNPDDYQYFFPRLVEELKRKIVFNYYFAFHDGFYDMFNSGYSQAPDDALDITFKSVSGDGEYDIDIKIFSASDERVKTFADGLRPFIVAILWLAFASYVVHRVNNLFGDN